MYDFNIGVEVEALDTDSFLKCAETLTRCGIKSFKEGENVLWQTCHILHKQNRYLIVHFKELFILDGKKEKTNFDQSDIDRRNLIAVSLENWGLVKLKKKIELPDYNIGLTIIPFSKKNDYVLKTKYAIGKIFK